MSGYLPPPIAAPLGDVVTERCLIAIERKTGAAPGHVGLSVPMFPPEILPAVEVGRRFDPSYWGRGQLDGPVCRMSREEWSWCT